MNFCPPHSPPDPTLGLAWQVRGKTTLNCHPCTGRCGVWIQQLSAVGTVSICFFLHFCEVYWAQLVMALVAHRAHCAGDSNWHQWQRLKSLILLSTEVPIFSKAAKFWRHLRTGRLLLTCATCKWGGGGGRGRGGGGHAAFVGYRYPHLLPCIHIWAGGKCSAEWTTCPQRVDSVCSELVSTRRAAGSEGAAVDGSPGARRGMPLPRAPARPQLGRNRLHLPEMPPRRQRLITGGPVINKQHEVSRRGSIRIPVASLALSVSFVLRTPHLSHVELQCRYHLRWRAFCAVPLTRTSVAGPGGQYGGLLRHRSHLLTAGQARRPQQR